MKFTMSPARAYLLGLWKSRRTKEGVGAEGRAELCEAFLQLVLSEKLAQPDKIQYREEKLPPRGEKDAPEGSGEKKAPGKPWASGGRHVLQKEGPSLHKCFFYNTALRAWLDSEMKKREERLKYKNEFAANYFAGVFDAKGGFWDDGKEKFCYLFGDRTDEIVLLRLGFRVKRERGRLAILSNDFYGWILPYLRLGISKTR